MDVTEEYHRIPEQAFEVLVIGSKRQKESHDVHYGIRPSFKNLSDICLLVLKNNVHYMPTGSKVHNRSKSLD